MFIKINAMSYKLHKINNIEYNNTGNVRTT